MKSAIIKTGLIASAMMLSLPMMSLAEDAATTQQEVKKATIEKPMMSFAEDAATTQQEVKKATIEKGMYVESQVLKRELRRELVGENDKPGPVKDVSVDQRATFIELNAPSITPDPKVIVPVKIKTKTIKKGD